MVIINQLISELIETGVEVYAKWRISGMAMLESWKLRMIFQTYIIEG